MNHTQKTFIILKMWNFKTLKIQKMFQNCFKLLKIQNVFTTYKWVIMYMMYEEKLVQNIIRLKNVKFLIFGDDLKF